jgi:hypothetical protein
MVTQFPDMIDAMIVLNGRLLFRELGMRFFPETGHLLLDGFLSYWERIGGLPVFGFPLTNE